MQISTQEGAMISNIVAGSPHTVHQCKLKTLPDCTEYSPPPPDTPSAVASYFSTTVSHEAHVSTQ